MGEAVRRLLLKPKMEMMRFCIKCMSVGLERRGGIWMALRMQLKSLTEPRDHNHFTGRWEEGSLGKVRRRVVPRDLRKRDRGVSRGQGQFRKN